MAFDQATDSPLLGSTRAISVSGCAAWGSWTLLGAELGARLPLQGLGGECEGVGQAPLRKRSLAHLGAGGLRSRALLNASWHVWIGAGSPLQGLEGECEGVGQAPPRERS